MQAELRGAVPQSAYAHYLAPLRARSLDGDVLTVAVPDRSRRWVGDRFGRLLGATVAAVAGPEVSVELISDTAPTQAAEAAAGGRAASELHPKYTFDQFIIGAGNRLAHGAALAVAELPGQAYNPLFLYGPPGTGKTHLLHSIGNYVRAHSPGVSVHYATVEEFAATFISAIQSGSMERFKTRYRDVDLLLIDDAQFLERKAKTEEEFFHTFNALHDTGGQLVVSCDRMPRDMGSLEDRLRERFESGLVADIEAPDYETRVTILHKRAQQDDLDVDESALELIAERVGGNVRALEGALIRVVAYHSLTGRTLDEDMVRDVLDRLYPPDLAPRPTVEQIQAATCEAVGIEPEQMVSGGRAARVAWGRQVAMYLSRRLTDMTTPAIGRRFGGRNHTTVLHACRRVDERVASDRAAAVLVNNLLDRLAAPGADRVP